MKKILLVFSIIFLAAACQNQPPSSITSNTSSPSTINPDVQPEQIHPVSLEALMHQAYDGRDLVLGKVLLDHAAYTRYYITYKSGKLAISGIMNIPKGTPPEGGWPILFLNHGHIDTSIYTNGRGLKREQDYLAQQGFAVLHSDYRNHAESSNDPDSENNFRLGYTEDVINAVLAVKTSKLQNINKEKIGMLGHSMGGGITQNVLVVKPGLVKAAVLYAPVSPRQSDNFERWTLGRREVSEKIFESYPAPSEAVCADLIERIGKLPNSKSDYLNNVKNWCAGEKNLEFWQNLSAENYFKAIQAPMLYFHGTSDDSVPIEWSRRSLQSLTGLDKNAELVEYPGQPHEFTPPTWNRFMEHSSEFFKTNL